MSITSEQQKKILKNRQVFKRINYTTILSHRQPIDFQLAEMCAQDVIK